MGLPSVNQGRTTVDTKHAKRLNEVRRPSGVMNPLIKPQITPSNIPGYSQKEIVRSTLAVIML